MYPSLPVAERPLEFFQEPGEVVFVPRGWWHSVVNHSFMVAYTQNFTSKHNLEDTIRDLRKDDPDLAQLLWSRASCGSPVATCT